MSRISNLYEKLSLFLSMCSVQSKNGIMKQIQDVFNFEESDSEQPKWELKLNKEDIKVFLKKGGSRINDE